MLMDSLSKEQKDQMLEEIAYFFNEEFVPAAILRSWLL